MQYSNFGKFIRNKRKALLPKVSLNTFAINCGFEPAILSRVETGKQDVKLSILDKIASGFDMTVSELLKEYEIIYKISNKIE